MIKYIGQKLDGRNGRSTSDAPLVFSVHFFGPPARGCALGGVRYAMHKDKAHEKAVSERIQFKPQTEVENNCHKTVMPYMQISTKVSVLLLVNGIARPGSRDIRSSRR
jgi:hypothetical protein